MCGITGIYSFDPHRPVDPAVLRSMTDVLRHRGPDSDGTLVRDGVGLGFRRLSIIDLSTAGNQPMSNEDGSAWIVFNGEFYGFEPHRRRLIGKGHVFRSRSDTETILHLFDEEGIACLQHIDGMFAFALFDVRNRALYLVRDRMGIKPLFIATAGDQVLFGSEMKALLEHPGLSHDIDETALHHYLTFMTVPAPRTMFRAIRKVLPGHYVKVTSDGVEDVQYWDLPRETDGSLTLASATEGVRERLYEAVCSQLVSDVPLGAFLSGGVDSSAVVAMMKRAGTPGIRTFSIGFPAAGDVDETPFARTVADHLGTEHRGFIVTPDMTKILPRLVWHFDEPFAVSSAFATYYLARMTRSDVTVALSGDGGDELFAGYPFRYSMDRRFRNAAWIPSALRALANDAVQTIPAFGPSSVRQRLIKLRTMAGFFTADADTAFFRTFTYFNEDQKEKLYAGSVTTRENSLDVLRSHYRSYHDGDAVNRRLYADMKTTLPDEMLTKVDRMTMAVSLEARVPLLDVRLVEYVARIPGHLKISGRNGKIPLKRAIDGMLPRSIIDRKKHGFNVPMDAWLRTSLKPMVHDLLSDDRTRQRGLFRPEAVRKVIDDHEQERANNGGPLYTLMTLELWYRMYVDRTLHVDPSGQDA